MNTAVRSLERVRDWLDERGGSAWIALAVVGLVVFWPIGLALIAYILWSKRMRCNRNHWGRPSFRRHGMGQTGNTAFDAIREETLKRLEEERDAFVSFLAQLRAAKDRAEFDQFMSSRQTPETV